MSSEFNRYYANTERIYIQLWDLGQWCEMKRIHTRQNADVAASDVLPLDKALISNGMPRLWLRI